MLLRGALKELYIMIELIQLDILRHREERFSLILAPPLPLSSIEPVATVVTVTQIV